MSQPKKDKKNPTFEALHELGKALITNTDKDTDFVPWLNHLETEGLLVPALFEVLTEFLLEVPDATKLARFISIDEIFTRGPSSHGNYYYNMSECGDSIKFLKVSPPYIRTRYVDNAATLATNLDGLSDSTKTLLAEASKDQFNNFNDLKTLLIKRVVAASYNPCGKPKKSELVVVTPDNPDSKSKARVFNFGDGQQTEKRYKAAGKALIAQPAAAQQCIDLTTFLERSPSLRRLEMSNTPLSPPTQAALAQIQAGRIFRVMKSHGDDVSNAKDSSNLENNAHDQNAGPSLSD